MNGTTPNGAPVQRSYAQGIQPERKVAISKISKDEKLNNHLNQFKFGMSHSSEASNV
jgi:hypothetical protein